MIFYKLDRLNFLVGPWLHLYIVPVLKLDGTTRLCMGHGKLNALHSTISMSYVTTWWEPISNWGATVLSKQDLKSSYHQVPVANSSQDYTRFILPWGKYRFTVMPFRLKNALTIFFNYHR